MIIIDEKTESMRSSLLYSSGLLQKPGSIALQALVELAAARFDCPIAAVTLLDRTMQTFKASVGVPKAKMLKSSGFCQYAILSNAAQIISDTLLDQRFANNLLVTEYPNLRFYAGWPLQFNGRHRIGVFCVLDTKPRTFGVKARSDLSRFALLAEKQLKDEMCAGQQPAH